MHIESLIFNMHTFTCFFMKFESDKFRLHTFET